MLCSMVQVSWLAWVQPKALVPGLAQPLQCRGGNAGFGCLLPPCLPFPSKPERGFEMLITNFTWSVKGSLSYFDVFLMRSGASQCKAEAHSGR